MAISGTGTGPFTITGTETTLAIYNAVVAANASNASKNSDNTLFDFNCVLYVGDSSTATSWTSTEESVRLDASAFEIRANATLTIGSASPARAGGYWRWQMANDVFAINGTLRAYASRIYSSGRVRVNTGGTVYFEECLIAALDSFDNGSGLNPNIQYARCNVAGATAVGVKLGGTVSLTGTKVSGAAYAYQPLPVTGQNPVTYTVSDHVGEGNTTDVVPNGANTLLNIDGAYELTAGVLVPRTGLISTQHNNNNNTVRLRWKYSLNCASAGTGASGVNVRIRNVNNTTVFSGQTAANGTITQQVLPRVELINNATNIPRFPYSVKARRFNLSSEQLVWQCDQHTTDKFVHSVKAFAPASEAAGLAFTGIAITASGAIGGTVTVTQPRTVAELWQYFCAWIAQTANFDSDDTWDFDGTTLNLGGWNLVNNSTIIGNITTSGTVTGTGNVNGVVLDANGIGAISVSGLGAADVAEMRKSADNSLIASRTGNGTFTVAPANVGVSVYFNRTAAGNLIMSTVSSPVTLTAGLNAEVPLYAGAQVQVAQESRIDLLPTLAEIEASALLAKQTTVEAVKSNTDLIPGIL